MYQRFVSNGFWPSYVTSFSILVVFFCQNSMCGRFPGITITKFKELFTQTTYLFTIFMWPRVLVFSFCYGLYFLLFAKIRKKWRHNNWSCFFVKSSGTSTITTTCNGENYILIHKLAKSSNKTIVNGCKAHEYLNKNVSFFLKTLDTIMMIFLS